MEEHDFRKHLPRYNGKYWENNQKLAIEIAEIAESKGITPAQLALAWILAQSENIIPIPGTKRIKYRRKCKSGRCKSINGRCF